MRPSHATLIYPAARVRHVVLSADQANSLNPAAWADVTGLSFTIEAGTYSFDFPLHTTTAASTTRMQLGITGPTLTSMAAVYEFCTSSGVVTVSDVATAYDTSATPASSRSASGMARLYGTITVSAAGTLQLRFKSNTNSSAVTIKANSFGVLYG